MLIKDANRLRNLFLAGAILSLLFASSYLINFESAGGQGLPHDGILNGLAGIIFLLCAFLVWRRNAAFQWLFLSWIAFVLVYRLLFALPIQIIAIMVMGIFFVLVRRSAQAGVLEDTKQV
jgi:hypothetical protein